MNCVYLLALLTFTLRCNALDFSLDKNLRNSREKCEVVCREGSPVASNKTQSLSSLRVFKRGPTTSGDNDGGKRRLLLASVSSEKPRLIRVSNGVKAAGLLEVGIATLSLKFVKRDDCSAEFICEVEWVNNEGKTMVSVSRILQQEQKEINEQKEATSWDAGSSMQMIVLLQQMFDKLEVLSGTVDSLKNDLRVTKETTEQDIEALKLDLNYKADRVEDKIQNLGKDLDSQTDRLEDKIEDFEKGQNEKLNQLKDKTESILVHLRDNFKSPINHKSVTESCTDKTANCVEGIVNKEIMSFNEKLSTIKDEISLLWTNVADSINVSCSKVVQKLDSRQALDQTLLQNLTQTSLKSTCQDDKDFTSFVDGKFDLLQNDIRVKFHEMSERMNLSDAETRSLFNAHTSVKNATFGYLQPALTELLTPTECYKGMSSLALSTSSPYAVIQPNKVNSLSAPVLCDTFTDGGGWTVFQRRVTGDVTFFRKWQDYKNGFGSFNGDFWLGNDNINAMTQNGVFELRVDMMYNGKFAYAHYDSFSVGDERSNYVLRVSSYKGDAGESLLLHNGMPFSTHDRDNDNWSKNCAVEYVGAWWYNACHNANLNGQWGSGSNKGPRWGTFSGVNAVTYSEMKFRRLV